MQAGELARLRASAADVLMGRRAGTAASGALPRLGFCKAGVPATTNMLDDNWKRVLALVFLDRRFVVCTARTATACIPAQVPGRSDVVARHVRGRKRGSLIYC